MNTTTPQAKLGTMPNLGITEATSTFRSLCKFPTVGNLEATSNLEPTPTAATPQDQSEISHSEKFELNTLLDRILTTAGEIRLALFGTEKRTKCAFGVPNASLHPFTQNDESRVNRSLAATNGRIMRLENNGYGNRNQEKTML